MADKRVAEVAVKRDFGSFLLALAAVFVGGLAYVGGRVLVQGCP
jgi:hypothetical protein